MHLVSGGECSPPRWHELLVGRPSEMGGLTISATAPVTVVDDAYLTHARSAPKISTPDYIATGDSHAVFQLAPQDPGVKREKPGGPSAEGARIEAPRGVGCGEGVSPSPLGEESGEGAPQKIFRFFSSKRRPLVHSGFYFCS